MAEDEPVMATPIKTVEALPAGLPLDQATKKLQALGEGKPSKKKKVYTPTDVKKAAPSPDAKELSNGMLQREERPEAGGQLNNERRPSGDRIAGFQLQQHAADARTNYQDARTSLECDGDWRAQLRKSFAEQGSRSIPTNDKLRATADLGSIGFNEDSDVSSSPSAAIRLSVNGKRPSGRGSPWSAAKSTMPDSDSVRAEPQIKHPARRTRARVAVPRASDPQLASRQTHFDDVNDDLMEAVKARKQELQPRQPKTAQKYAE
jgi:hypothetical protein